MLSSTPHAFFAWRVIFVALGLARCISLPHFRLHPFPLFFPLFVQFRLRVRFPRAAFGGAGSWLRAFLMKSVNQGMGATGWRLDGVGIFNLILRNASDGTLHRKIS